MKWPERSESGSALIEFTWLAVILIVPLVWLVVAVFQVQQGAFALSAAANAAGRAYALAPDEATGRVRARQVVQQVLADQGVAGQRAQINVTCQTPVRGHCLVGQSVITVELSSSVRFPATPRIFGQDMASVDLDATHTVPYGHYVASGGGRR